MDENSIMPMVSNDRDPTPKFAPEEQHSKFKLFSLGRVAENKKLDSKIIEVYPTEELPFVDGEVTAHQDEVITKGIDDLKASYQTKSKTTVTIEAEWLPMSENHRLTAPDVRRGERVLIWRYADVDKYYWSKYGEDHDLRKLETIIWAISANKDEDTKLTTENSYYVEVSSHKKNIRIHTSKVNGEPFIYDIELNTATGQFRVSDDIGNSVSMDSSENRIELINADGAHYDMHRRNLTVTIPDTILYRASSIIYSANIVEFIGGNGSARLDKFKVNARATVLNSLLHVNEDTTIHGELVSGVHTAPKLDHAPGGPGPYVD